MARLQRRTWVVRALALAAVPALGGGLGLWGKRALAQAGEPQVVKLVAQRFKYTPAEFQVTAGRPVVLEITSLDFVHGFSMAAMQLRADLPPGPPIKLSFTAGAPGNYDFVCDNFCGDHHEDMYGRMVVVPA